MSRRLIATLVAVLVVLSVGTVVVVASRHTSATTPSSEGTEVEPRGGESAREEAEEQAEELRPEAGVARVHDVASAPAAGWQAEQVWSTTANVGNPRSPRTPWATRSTRPPRATADPRRASSARSSDHRSELERRWHNLGPGPVHLFVQERQSAERPAAGRLDERHRLRGMAERLQPRCRILQVPRPRGDVSTAAERQGEGLSSATSPSWRLAQPARDVYIAWNAERLLHERLPQRRHIVQRAGQDQHRLAATGSAEGGVVAPNGNVSSVRAPTRAKLRTGRVEARRDPFDGTAARAGPPPSSTPRSSSLPATFRRAHRTLSHRQRMNGTRRQADRAYRLDATAAAPKDLYIETPTPDGGVRGALDEISQTRGTSCPVIGGTREPPRTLPRGLAGNRNGATAYNTWSRRTRRRRRDLEHAGAGCPMPPAALP